MRRPPASCASSALTRKSIKLFHEVWTVLSLFLSGDLKIILAELCVLSRENLQFKKHRFLSPDNSKIAMSNSCTDDSWASCMSTSSRHHGDGMFVNNSEGFQKSKFNQHRGNPTVVSRFTSWFIRYLRISVIGSSSVPADEQQRVLQRLHHKLLL